MASIYSFLFYGHDLRLVLIAAVICLASSLVCISLLQHARISDAKTRNLWILFAAFALGFGIWSTHFMAMIAYDPGFEVNYYVLPTALSLFAAVIVCGAGLWLASRARGNIDFVASGFLVGTGIACLHFMAINAMSMGGQIIWNRELIITSVVFGIVFASLSLAVVPRAEQKNVLPSATLLAIAICSMHFIAIAGMDLSDNFPIRVGGLDKAMIATIVAFSCVLVMGGTVGSMVVDNRDRIRNIRETLRQQADADKIASVSRDLELALSHMGHALCLFDVDEKLVLHNKRLNDILSLPSETDLRGISLDEMFFLNEAMRGVPEDQALIEGRRQAELHRNAARQPGGGDVFTSFGADGIARAVHTPINDGSGSWVATIEDITERQRSEAKIAFLAQHDSLTGLPNRSKYLAELVKALTRAAETGTKVAVIGIDLDRFQEINDVFGHESGDEVLRTIASRISDGLDGDEVIARFGGDEFMAIKAYSRAVDLEEFIDRIRAAFAQKFTLGGNDAHVSCCVGVALYPTDGQDCDKLINNATLAMYRSKATMGEQVSFYEPEMDENSRARRLLAKDIWTALECNQFTLNYQIQRSLTTGAPTGYEALLRWNHPVRGWVSPAEFIPLAEECGAIGAIGDWVLETACREIAKSGVRERIAINLSALQLADPKLIEKVRRIIEGSDVLPSQIELEVTETAIISDPAEAFHVLRQLKAMGIAIALDDFGTGYSSLETLRAFPFDKIKLDRSFVTELEQTDQSKAIIRAIVALGRALGMRVLTEGVETAGQAAILLAEGCEEAQGYYYGRPEPIEKITQAQRNRLSVVA